MQLLELTRTAHRRPPPFSQVLSLVTHRIHGAEPRATKTTPSKALRTPNCAPSWLGRFARATRLHPIISPALPNHILKCLSCATDDFSRHRKTANTTVPYSMHQLARHRNLRFFGLFWIMSVAILVVHHHGCVCYYHKSF